MCVSIIIMKRKIKNVIVCGIGAVGSIYAEKFKQNAECDLRVLVDEDRLKRYSNEPIIFNGQELMFNYVLPSVTNFKADLIVIATKFDGLPAAVINIKNFIKEDTIIMPLLNGVTSEEIVAREYGWDKVLYSYFIGHSAVREGRSVTHDD